MMSFQNQLRSLRSNPRAALAALLVLPRFTQHFLAVFPWRPSLISLRIFQRDRALRGLASFELRSCGGRHEDLAEILFAGGWRAGDRLRPRFGITESRRSAPASASTKPVGLPAGRSVHKRCSVDCGVTHRRCKSRASFRGSLSKHGAFLSCKGFYSIGGLVKTEILRTVCNHWCAAHQPEQDQDQAIAEMRSV
jgi:hypothetical protein